MLNRIRNLGIAIAITASPLTGHAQVTAPRDTTTHDYRGAYQTGFEKSWFAPCATASDDKLWWVTLTDDALRQRDSLIAARKLPATDGFAVTWRATISPRMPAGHMGRGTRYMLVTSILDIRQLPSDWSCLTT